MIKGAGGFLVDFDFLISTNWKLFSWFKVKIFAFCVKYGETLKSTSLDLIWFTSNHKFFRKSKTSFSVAILSFNLTFNLFLESTFKSADNSKKLSGLKFLISFSLSTISLTATDCTLQAESHLFIFCHKIGETL